MGVSDLVITTYSLLFVVLAVRALRDWRRGIGTPGASLWFAQIFLALASVSIAAVVVSATGTELPNVVAGILLMAVVYYPYALFRFMTALQPVSMAITRGATVSTILLLAWLAVLVPTVRLDGSGTAMVQLYVWVESIQWLILTAIAIWVVWRAARGQPDIVRRRLRSLALGAGLLSIANVLRAGAGEDALVLSSSLLTLLGAIGFAIGYAPPAFLRELWNRHDRTELRHAIVSIMAAGSTDEAARALLPSAAAMVGGTGAALIGPRGELLATHRFDEDRARRVVARLADEPRADGRALVMLEDTACCSLDDTWVLVAVSTCTPLLGTQELDVLESVVTTTSLALGRMRALDALREREAQLLQAQRIASIGSFEWNPVSDELHLSHELCQLLGIDPADDTHPRRDLIALVPPEDAIRLTDGLDAAARHARSFSLDHEVVRADGTRLVMHTRGRGIDGPGGMRVAGTVQDVSERKLVEEALRDAFVREREAADQLRSLDRLKDDILVAVSHELRTPLTSILGFAHTLRDRDVTLDERTRLELLDHMTEQSCKLDRLLTDLLDLNRLRRGAMLLHPAHTDVARLVVDCASSLAIPENLLDLQLDEGSPMVDAAKVERIVENLLTNARKYGPSGGMVRVRFRIDADGVELVVQDEGPGVPPAERESVFEPFHRVASTSAAPGSGIGLSLVAQYARLHGGRAWIEGRTGGGTSVHVRLRLLAEDPQA